MAWLNANPSHYQFYLEDTTIPHKTGNLWGPQAFANRLDELPGLIAVSTGRWGGDVPLDLKVQSLPPEAEDWAAWDHVAEVSLEVRSGRLPLTSPESFGTEVDSFAIAPGQYRARVYYGDLDKVYGGADLDGDDHYRIVLWLGPPPPPPRGHSQTQPQ
jgi:hypothetical protein